MDNKTYHEIKVTFAHILVMIFAIIVLGIMLFYLGFRAGKAAAIKASETAATSTTPVKTEEVKVNQTTAPGTETVFEPALATEQPSATDAKTAAKENPAISQELQLHQAQQPAKTEKQVAQKPMPTAKTQPVAKEPPPSRESAYSIQIGAFSDFSSAKKAGEKYEKMGYSTEIIMEKVNNKIFNTVRIGSFKTMADAQKEKEKLEKAENKKFLVKKSR